MCHNLFVSATRCILFFTALLFSFSFAPAADLQGAEPDNATVPDVYEPDNTPAQATLFNAPPVCGYSAEMQHHNFFVQGDEDWFTFYAFEDEPYTIAIKNPGASCDTVIELYDTDAVTLLASRDYYREGEEELLEWICDKDGFYYIRLTNYDPAVSGDNTGYDIVVYVPLGGEGTGVISGMITDAATGNPIDGALITTTLNVSFKAIDGYYIMLHPAGLFSLTVSAEGYAPASSDCMLDGCALLQKDFSLLPVNTSDNAPCIVDYLFGAHSPEASLLRNFRDTVLQKTAWGRKCVQTYYAFSPYMVHTIQKCRPR